MAERDDNDLHTQRGLAYSVEGLGQREMIVFYTPRADWLTLLVGLRQREMIMFYTPKADWLTLLWDGGRER